MRIAEINMVDYGSTGRLMLQIADCARTKGHEVQTFSMKWKNQKNQNKGHTYFGTYFENAIHQVIGRINGRGGCYSCIGTKQLIKQLEKFNPDIVHLHNLHNSYIDINQLFHYLNKNHKKVVWTLHDCWSFTGKCTHFLVSKCDKWKSGCKNCQALSDYPSSKMDFTKSMWNKKKRCYGKMSNMTIVTPSKWLASLVKQSFLKENQIVVINNGIDLDVFRPTKSDFRLKYGLQTQKIVLGVSFGWSNKKGIDDMVRLSKELPENYSVVMIGVDDFKRAELPDNIIAIGRTSSKEELAQIYSAADVFVNPTKEENFPTVNIEAIACGTPVITLNTGGCGEMLNERCGIVVENYEQMLNSVIKVCENNTFSAEDCVQKAQGYSSEICADNYLNLYEKFLRG